MDTFNISRLAILLLIGAMLTSVIATNTTSEPQDVNVADIPAVTVLQPQAPVSAVDLSGDPVPDTGIIHLEKNDTIPVKVDHQAGKCSRYQAPFLEAQCTALKNTLLLRIFLALG
jgi:hypothetical protein